MTLSERSHAVVPTAPDGYSTRLHCRQELIHASEAELLALWPKMQRTRENDFANSQVFHPGEMTPAVRGFFAATPDAKMSFLTDLYWSVSSRKLKVGLMPDDGGHYPPDDPHRQIVEQELPLYAGRMLFEGAHGKVRAVIFVIDRSKIVVPAGMKLTTPVATNSRIEISLSFVDKTGALTKEEVEDYGRSLVIAAGLTDVIDIGKRSEVGSPIMLVTTSDRRKTRTWTVSLHYLNLYSTNRRAIWLWENIRKSLDPAHTFAPRGDDRNASAAAASHGGGNVPYRSDGIPGDIQSLIDQLSTGNLSAAEMDEFGAPIQDIGHGRNRKAAKRKKDRF